MLACSAIRAEETNDMVHVPLEDYAPEVRTNELISVQFTNTPLARVVQYFAEQQRLNVVCVMDSLTNRVTANLDKVYDKPALEAILETCGLLLLETVPGSGIYTVKPIRTSEPVWTPFTVTVHAPRDTYYEIHIRTHGASRPQLVSSGAADEQAPRSHQLSAAGSFIVIQVTAEGYKTWERSVRLLHGGDSPQSFTAVLEPDPKKQ